MVKNDWPLATQYPLPIYAACPTTIPMDDFHSLIKLYVLALLEHGIGISPAGISLGYNILFSSASS